ncbi:MAG TPA: NUDIX domain-containing protein [Candidatus Limnocylindrales bacterium]|nr:NUDIX domain-containing protein [Candidatus Limnocylindrales bacterium]
MNERVLVVPRTAVISRRGWHGIRTRGLPGVLATIDREGRFEPRAEVELDPRWKQVIPYLVVRDGPRWFLMQRTRGGADRRLHEQWSIGVGGHLNPGDGDLLGGLRREWREEVVADFEPQPRMVGLLNDDSTEVGRVHLGVVFEADAAGRPVAVRETTKLRGAFATSAEVRAVADRLETWSKLVFERLDNPAGRSVRL